MSSTNSANARQRAVRIGKRWVGPGHPVYVIAEIGANFDGNLRRARQLIDLALEAGADATKFQTYRADSLLCRRAFEDRKTRTPGRSDLTAWEACEQAELPRGWHRVLAEHCAKRGIDFLSSPYDREAVDLLVSLEVRAIKVGSGEITWLEMLDYLARQGRPLLLSTGASDLDEVRRAVEVIRAGGNDELVLLQSVSAYPTSFADAHLRAMASLAEDFGLVTGYSDHSRGCTVPLGAVALGASVIEKHFTDDKNRHGPDHAFALDFNEFRRLVEEIRQLEAALGRPEKRRLPCERQTAVAQRRGLYAARYLPAGATLAEDMLVVLRPADGLPASQWSRVIGQTLCQSVEPGEPLTAAHLGWDSQIDDAVEADYATAGRAGAST